MATTTSTAGGVTLEKVIALAKQLRPLDQARLVVRLAPTVEMFLEQIEDFEASQPRQPLRGSFSDLGAAPSTEDIDEVQREIWSTFGQE